MTAGVADRARALVAAAPFGMRAEIKAEMARRGLASFCALMDPSYERAAHAARIIEHLEALERGDIRRLAVFMPPRHSKSYHVSERFPAWALGRDPRRKLILASYGQRLAERASRIVRNLLGDDTWPFPAVRIAADSAAVDRWGTSAGGEVIAAGVGGAMTGHGADILIIDDPVKGREEADSDVVRASTWDWYAEVARTRLMPRGRIVLCQTRWHEDDLAGRILNSAGAADWTVLNLPAVAEADEGWRQRGDALWPAWFDEAALGEARRDLTTEQGARAWWALYQQRPTSDEGGLIKRAWLQARYEDVPTFKTTVLAVDAAFKAGINNDYSALVVAGTDGTDFYVVDVRRGRLEYPDLRRAITDLAAEYRPHAVAIEDTAAGQSVIQDLRRTTALPLVPVKVTASKIARATAVAPLFEAGRVKLPKGAAWVGAFVEEVAAFPQGQHDDQLDAVVHALARLQAHVAGARRQYGPIDAVMRG